MGSALKGVSSLTDKSPSTKRFHVRKRKTNPRRVAYVVLLLFASPPSLPLAITGAVLVVAALLFHGWAAGYLARAGNEERETILTVRGPYRHNRNPYYVAHMTMDLGFFCLAGLPFLYLLYFPVIFSSYRTWVMNEERFLEKAFGNDYERLKREVPRWWILLTPAPARGPKQNFNWAIFKINEEMPRLMAHLFFLGLMGFYIFLGNPLINIDSLVRFTIVGAIFVWLVLHDIYPLDVSRKSGGWTLLALLIGTLTISFLSWAPVWDRRSGTAAWISILAGISLGLIVSAAASPAILEVIGKKNQDLFTRPMSQWYLFGLGLGLLSCTLGGVWLGIVLPLFFWAMGIAGFVPIRMAPKQTVVGLGLLMIFIFSGGFAVMRLLS